MHFQYNAVRTTNQINTTNLNVAANINYNNIDTRENCLIQNLRDLNYNYCESELMEFFFNQNELYIFLKQHKVKNINYLIQMLQNNIYIYPVNVTILNNRNYYFPITIYQNQPTDNEIIEFCEKMKNKNIFLDLDRSNFLLTSNGIFIKKTDCFLPRPCIFGILIQPKCPEFHNVVEDFVNGIKSEDKLYWCPTCQRHYHSSAIKFDKIKEIIDEVK